MNSIDPLDNWTPSTSQRQVRDAIAEIFKVQPHELIGRARRHPLVDYRHIAMWTIRECFPLMSYPMIGRLFGGRDHSTVIHGVRKVNDKRRRDPKFVELTDNIRASFGVREPGLQLNEEVRLRLAEVVARVEEAAREAPPPARPRPVTGAVAPIRRVKPKNDFGEEQFDARRSRALLDPLGAAIEREGLVCR